MIVGENGEMLDGDKILEGLECCSGDGCEHEKCPYYDKKRPGTCGPELHRQAALLVKELLK